MSAVKIQRTTDGGLYFALKLDGVYHELSHDELVDLCHQITDALDNFAPEADKEDD